MEILPITIALLGSKRKATNKTLGQFFLKELKITCKNSGELVLMQQALDSSKIVSYRVCSQWPYWKSETIVEENDFPLGSNFYMYFYADIFYCCPLQHGHCEHILFNILITIFCQSVNVNVTGQLEFTGIDHSTIIGGRGAWNKALTLREEPLGG